MPENPPPSADTLEKLALALKTAEAKIQSLECAQNEPIAVIGLACRFPGGVATPEQFWSLLEQGKDALSGFPVNRWPEWAGQNAQPEALVNIPSLRGGYLDENSFGFDADFFGLTPEEVRSTAPQHRLLLEVAWEALENAGLEVAALKGSPTGVFIGISGADLAPDAVVSGGFSANGSDPKPSAAASVGSGLIARFLGLEGPNMAVDTAGSSSLVALHLACQSLRSGESHLALAGGVNLILKPETSLALYRQQKLSPSGCCRVFDSGADGYVRAEGCGVLVLQNYSEAVKAGNPVLALIAGSAVNHDGCAQGAAEPEGHARKKNLAEALQRAGLSASDIQYVEAHGEGTSLADAVEIQSLASVYGAGRTARNPLWAGSAKANLGDLEAAAGCAGLIKTILQLRHRAICPQPHFNQPNPRLSWRDLPIQIPTAKTGWPQASVRAAAVSAFGGTGTNAHVLLREAPPAPVRATPDAQRPLHLLAFSAPNPAGLKASANQLAGFLELAGPAEPGAGDICFATACARSGFAHRLAVLGKTKSELQAKLKSWAEGKSGPGVWSSSRERTAPPRLAFMFTGQGSQYRQMGADLWASQPVFQAVLQQCDAILRPHMEIGLLDLIYNPGTPDDQIHQTIHTQPVIFAFGYALAKMWESWGVTPSVVLGHSIGEVAAACFAGVMSLEDALGLVALRGRLIHRATQPGTMGAIVAPAERVAAAIRELGGQVAIAAINAPENVVISGNTEDVRRILEHFKDLDIPSLALRISHAIHSPLMEPILDEYTAAAARISFSQPKIPLISNLTGRVAGDEITRPEYWRRQLRQTVNFRACLDTLRDSGCQIALETGATSILSSMGAQCLPGSDLLWLHSLGPKNSLFNMRPQRLASRSDWETLLDTLGQLYAGGANLKWRQIESGFAAQPVRLPNYPFQRASWRS